MSGSGVRMTASDVHAGQVMGGRSPREPPVSPCSLTSDGRSSPSAVGKQPFSPVSLGAVADLSRTSVLGNKCAVTEAACLDDAHDLMLVSCDAMPSAAGPDGLNDGDVSAGGHDGATAPSAATAAACDTSLLDACSRVAPGLSDVASEVMSAAPGAACVNFAQATSAVADVASPDAASAPAAASSDVCPPASEPRRPAGPAPRRSARARVPSAIAASAAAAPVKRERRRKRCDAFPVEQDVAPVGKRPSSTDDGFSLDGPSPLELSKSRASSALPRQPTLDLPLPRPSHDLAHVTPGRGTPTAAADIKRQQLLARLHAINAEKAKLALASPIPRHSVSSSQLQGLLTPACPPVTPATSGSALYSQGRSCASPAASTSTCGATALTALDLGADRVSGVGSGPATPGVGTEGRSTSTTDRVSRRPSRPRTPSVWLKPAPGEPTIGALTTPTMPSGWSRDPRVKYCRRIVNELLRHTQAKPFSAPVNELWPPESIPNYFVIVKQPMDLGTIKRTLEAGGYCSFDSNDVAAGRMMSLARFQSDVLQVFTNAMLYNRPGDSLYQCAFTLRDEFQRLLIDVPDEAPPAAKGAARRGSRRAKTAPAVKAKKASPAKRGSPTSPSASAPKAAAPKRAPKGKRPVLGTAAPEAPGARGSAATLSGASGEGAGSCSPGQAAAGSRPAKLPVPAPPQSVREIRRKLAQLQDERAYVEVFSMGHAKGGAGFMKRAAMLYHVEMRFEEKERLGNNISTLSVDKLGKVVQLVARKSAGRAEVNNNDEYELDMDALDNNTLREMEAYVEACLPAAKRRTVKDVSSYPSVAAIDSAMLVLRTQMTNILARREQARAHRRRMGSYSSEDSDSSDGDSSDGDSSDSGSRSSDSDSSSSGESGSDTESEGE